MVKVVRLVFGTFLLAVILYASTWAVHDCPVGELVYENCLWIQVRDYLGLPPSKLGRAAALEVVGLFLLFGLYLTVRYFFLPLRGARPPDAQGRGATSARGAESSTG